MCEFVFQATKKFPLKYQAVFILYIILQSSKGAAFLTEYRQ